MRGVLSEALVEQASKDKNFIVLSGDHGYALFDELRNTSPNHFVNVGIMEQSMVGMAVGLVSVGYKPVIYGLASFVPMRVLEQIKLDVCFSKSPVKIIGDGAGVVYSQLGNSHFCVEDIGCLMTLPEIEIYTPGDANEMRVCLIDFFNSNRPGYLRVGKADNPSTGVVPKGIEPYFTNQTNNSSCIVSMGSMNGISAKIAKQNNLSHLAVLKLKPISHNVVDLLKQFKRLIIVEEHQKIGGLKSILLNEFSDKNTNIPECEHFCFQNKFVHKCGTYQYVLSEHNLSFIQLEQRIKKLC
ncbi:MAG: transketolase [Halobacteriovoraceae bacterium]|jgi:transketolase|nr:transketolase [Halobacteriovoraceae bacterium]